jgi:flavin-dependent thymidylate synthase
MTTKEASEEYIVAEEIDFLGAPVGDRFVEPEKEISGYDNLKVELTLPISKEAYADWVSAALYNSLCTWDATPHLPIVAMDKLSLEEKEKKLFYILKKRPISVAFEGTTFNFRILNVPRSMTHQIVRHRQMAFGQQSYRVSSCYSDAVRVPQSLLDAEKTAENTKLIADFEEAVINNRKVYKELILAGIPMEQARNIMPMGTCTKIGITMRLRDMIDYVKGRTGDIAQDEHTYIVCLMLKELKEKQNKFYEVIKMFVPKVEETMAKYLKDFEVSRPD